MAPSTTTDEVEENIREGYMQSRHISDVSKAEQDYDQAVEVSTGISDNDSIVFVKTFYNQNQETIQSTATGLASLTAEGRSIESAVSNFSETAKVIIKGLDALAQVHPAIGVAVLAFKLVVTFDMTRRENNKKVLALKIEMQDMMAVLFELRHIRDPIETGPSESILGARMQVLMEKIAHDIKDAGSACDAYMKKSFLARTLKSKIYESRLAEYGATFETNKLELQRALTLHTACGVDVAAEMLGTQNLKLDSMESKINEVLQVFRKLDSPREKDVQKFLEESGGPKTCIENDHLLTKLVEISGETLSAEIGMAERKDLRHTRGVLLKELQEDVNKMFETNFIGFQRKLAMQSHQLDVIQASNEHIVTMLSSGSHEKIADHDMQTIWREMDWKGSVKARHFVLALHDYFSDQSSFPSHNSNRILSPSGIDDRWALAYINIAHVQSIMEAVDDDGTGFVSIREVNTFVSSQPLEWTLLQRLAYWAAGWHLSISSYKRKIFLQVQRMFKLKARMPPANRRLVDEYLASIPLACLETILRSTKPGEVQHHPELAKLVERYDREEEMRLTENLKTVAYELDSVETVALITGPGRIERYLFPLVHILLKHVYRIMALACTQLLHADELQGPERSLYSVFGVVDERVRRMTGSFKHIQVDVKGRLEVFALGMFSIWYQQWPASHVAPPITQENAYLEWYDDSPEAGGSPSEVLEDLDAIPVTELKLGPLDLTVLTKDIMDPGPSIAKIPDDGTLLGHWSGHFWFITSEGIRQSYVGLTDLRIDGMFMGTIRGAAQNWNGEIIVHGELRKDNEIKLEMQYNTWASLFICEGKFDPERQRIEGSWIDKAFGDNGTHTVVFSRTPIHLERFRYTPTAFQANPARARWTFAIEAIRDEVRRKSWSWTYLKCRLDEIKLTVSLGIRQRIDLWTITPNNKPSEEELQKLYTLQECLPAWVGRLCSILANFHLMRLMVRHMGAWCDSCRRVLYELRIICLICVDKDFTNTLDVCQDCIGSSCSQGQLKHDPSHSMIKCDYIVYNFKRIWPCLDIAARAKTALKEDAAGANPSILCVGCSKLVTVPCWVCHPCTSATFICLDCEEKKISPPEGHAHQTSHTLIRIGTTNPDPQNVSELSVEARLGVFEAKMEQRTNDLERRVTQLDAKVEERLIQLDAKVEERLTRLETKMEGQFQLLGELLNRIAAKVESAPQTIGSQT